MKKIGEVMMNQQIFVRHTQNHGHGQFMAIKMDFLLVLIQNHGFSIGKMMMKHWILRNPTDTNPWDLPYFGKSRSTMKTARYRIINDE